jgi:hypothetical protein
LDKLLVVPKVTTRKKFKIYFLTKLCCLVVLHSAHDLGVVGAKHFKTRIYPMFQ